MAENRRREKSADSRLRIISAVGDHRTNNLLFGHVGRLTYVVPEEGGGQDRSGIGEMHTNRIFEQDFSLQELSPFRAWYGATKDPALGGDYKGIQRQLGWLSRNAPDALIGVVGPWKGVERELKATAAAQPYEARRPLLAYGEIADHSIRRFRTCSVFAMAVGSQGQTLRVVRSANQKYRRNKAEDESTDESTDELTDETMSNTTDRMTDETTGRIDFVTTDCTDEGHWCSNTPITQIKCTAAAESADVLRCILVQTGVGTLLFEPSVRLQLVDNEHPTCSFVARGPAHIQVVPAMQIRTSDTGGDRHCDVSWWSGADEAMPQLAIIDTAGNWTVWRIEVRPKAIKHRFHRSLRARGDFATGIPAAMPPPGMHGRRRLHSVVWLPGGEGATLLLGNDAFLQSVDVDSQTPHQILRLTRQNGVDAVLDVQPCPSRQGGVFALTTTAVFWLDPATSHSAAQQEQPAVLLSCPHLRDPADATMKMAVVPYEPLQGRATSLVFVYSARHVAMTVFRFGDPGSDGQASFQQQQLEFAPTAASRDPERPGEQTMLVLPRGVQAKEDGTPLDVFQMVALGPDLDLRSAVCVSSVARGRVAWQFLKTGKKQVPRKGKLRTDRDSGFVVPEGEEIAVQSIRRRIEQSEAEAVTTKPFPAMNLSLVLRLVDEGVARRAEAANEATSAVRGFGNASPLEMIRRVVETGMANGSHPFTTLLHVADGDFLERFGADLTDLAWAQTLADLDVATGRLRVFDQTADGVGRDDRATTLYEALQRLCAAPEAVEAVRPAGLVAAAAVQLYLSLISTSVVSRQLLRSSRTTPLDGRSPASATSPWRAGAIGRLRASETAMEMSSSPPGPSWLPSSQGEEEAEDEGMMDDDDDDDDDEEDAAVARLRQYVVSIRTEAPRREGELRLLSHWQLGSDPSQFTWRPVTTATDPTVEEEKQAEEAARERRRQRNARRTQQERERAARRWGDDGGLPVRSAGALGGALGAMATPSAPRIRTVDVAPSSPAASSQVFSSQVYPRSSQMLGSSQGLARRLKPKKPKRAGGFK